MKASALFCCLGLALPTAFGAFGADSDFMWFDGTSAGDEVPDNADVRVYAKVVPTAFGGGEEAEIVAGLSPLPQAALSLRRRGDGTLTFLGLTSSRSDVEDSAQGVRFRWLEMSAPGVVPEEGVGCVLGIERDFGCVPIRVRYTVNGVTLRDALGNEWQSTHCVLDPAEEPESRPAAARRIGFAGRCEVGEIRTEVTSRPCARARVDFGRVNRPRAGVTELLPTVTPNDDVTLAGDLRFSWFLTDAAGMRVAGSERGAGASYVLAADDVCHWVTVEVADDNGFLGAGRFWFSDLPVVILDVDDGAGKPVWPSAAKESHTGAITILGNGEYEDQIADPMPLSIHVRGNSTANLDKKPYKIKLGKKTDIFGLGAGVANKHWLLLANVLDESLMRNKLCCDLSGVLGVPVWMKSEWVDVVMNGQYVGNYLLCQHIRVGDDRIPIYDWDAGKVAEQTVAASSWLTEADEDALGEMLEADCRWMSTGEFVYGGSNYVLTASKGNQGVAQGGKVQVYWKGWNGGDISGGYVFEIDGAKMAGQPAAMPSTFKLKYSGRSPLLLDVAVNTPECAFTDAAVSNEIWNLWNDLGTAWIAADGCDARGRHYSELADFDSMVAYWLSEYVPGNNDAAFRSRYAYKDIGGKMMFGPAWDFDFGIGSLPLREWTAVKYDSYGQAYYGDIEPEAWVLGSVPGNFIGRWTSDPYFTFRLRERYLEKRAALTALVEKDGLIDRYKAKIGRSARANDLRWNSRIGFWGNAQEKGDVEVLREFLTRRFAWLDEQFATVGTAICNVSETSGRRGDTQYVRDLSLQLTFADASVRPGSVETDLVDVVRTVGGDPVPVTVRVPAGAMTLAVTVNGRFRSTWPVMSNTVAVTIAAEDLLFGRSNFIAFSANDGYGFPLARNAALLTCDLPDRVGDDVPDAQGVTIEWLDAAYTALASSLPEFGVTRPSSYFEYAAFAIGDSPIGKRVGGRSVPLVYDWVAGTDPADVNDVFFADIALGADGIPSVSWHPNPCENGTRVYTLFGARALDGPWEQTDATHPASGFLEGNRFFKVKVRMPER